MIAIDDQAWVIWHDLSVIEVEDYFAIGSGSDVATGALYATKDKNPFERIVTCIDAAAETTLFVDDGVDLVATSIKKEDKKLIAKALNIPEIMLEEDHQKEQVDSHKETANTKTSKKSKKSAKK